MNFTCRSQLLFPREGIDRMIGSSLDVHVICRISFAELDRFFTSLFDGVCFNFLVDFLNSIILLLSLSCD
jgi:hypothetical protein